MTAIVTPTFNSLKMLNSISTLQAGVITSVTMAPTFFNELSVFSGVEYVFEEDTMQHDIAVPIPRLEGLDEIELDSAGFSIWSSNYDKEVEVAGTNVSAEGISITCPLTSPAVTAQLTKIEIENLRLTLPGTENYSLEGDRKNATASRVLFAWNEENGSVDRIINGSASGAKQLHFLLRSQNNGAVGPPAAAAPLFAMPGAGSGLYGPALGNASVSVVDSGSNRVKAIIRLYPPMNMSAVKLLFGSAEELGVNAGLPNDFTGFSWQMDSIRTTFIIKPAGISIKAVTPSDSLGAVVSTFETDPGTTPHAIDFAPAARSLLRKEYPLSSGDDLGLTLQVSAETPGTIKINLAQAAARYLYYPHQNEPQQLSLKGHLDTIDIPLSTSLLPNGLSFTLNGVFGPIRLTDASDYQTEQLNHGFRIAGSTSVARFMPLTQKEQNLPIARVSLFGRAQSDAELMVTLHKGDANRVGPVIGTPISTLVTATAHEHWIDIAIAAKELLPPHPSALWMVVRVVKGVFYWYGTLQQTDQLRYSKNEGLEWDTVQGQTIAAMGVTEVDRESNNPYPLFPVSLGWNNGILNGDLVGMESSGTPGDYQLTRYWIAHGTDYSSFFEEIATLEEPLRLNFFSRRDIEITLNDIVMLYDPWQRGEV